MTSLLRLQGWFERQCNGDWEHRYGVTIETLDNPGWFITIDLSETYLENRPFTRLEQERSENNWVHAWTSENKFEIACGVENLEEAIKLFCDWANVGIVD